MFEEVAEYSSVAYLVERPTRETQVEQYSDTANPSQWPTIWQFCVLPLRGAPSAVETSMTSSGWSMERGPPKKEMVPTVLGVAQF